jgi:hypothetical protein
VPDSTKRPPAPSGKTAASPFGRFRKTTSRRGLRRRRYPSVRCGPFDKRDRLRSSTAQLNCRPVLLSRARRWSRD